MSETVVVQREQAINLAGLRKMARSNFEFWSKLAHSQGEPISQAAKAYHEGQAHAYARVLIELGEDVQCACRICVEKRMLEMEKEAHGG